MAEWFSVGAALKARDGLSRVVVRMSRTWTRSMKRMDRSTALVNRGVNRLGGSLKRVATATAAAAGVAAAGAGLVAKSVVASGAEFEAAIAGVGSVMLKTKDQIADLEAKALELGKTTKFTASEAAGAMEIMARAGFKNQEILSGVDGVLAAAAASGLEIAEVADHVSNALKGMGLEASEAGRVADVLALASSRTNSSIGSLGESIRNVASTARQLNIPLEDVVSSVALLQDVGLDASVAGSAFNTMLTKMAKPPAHIAAKMKELGISFKDAKGNMLPLGDVLRQLSDATEKVGGNFDQVSFLADLVGLRGQKAAANLKDLFAAGKVTALSDELRDAAGSAEKMAALKMNNLIGDWTLFGSAVDGLKVALFNLEKGPLRGFVQSMTKWVSLNTDQIVDKVSDAFAGLRMLVKSVAPVLETFWLSFRAAFGATERVNDATSAFQDFTRWLQKPETQDSAARWGILLGKAAKALLILGETIIRYLPELLTFVAVVKGSRLAVKAYEVVIWTWALAKKAFVVLTKLGVIWTKRSIVVQILAAGKAKALAAATWALTTAQRAYKAATVAATLWTGRAAAAAVLMAGRAKLMGISAMGAAGGLAAMGAAAAAAAAAVAAAVAGVMLAIKANNDLKKQTEGLGIFDIAGGMIEKGTFDPFAVVDAHQNALAKQRAEERAKRSREPKPQPVTEQERLTASMRESMGAAGAFEIGKGTITIKDETGKAQVIDMPEGLDLQLASSGDF